MTNLCGEHTHAVEIRKTKLCFPPVFRPKFDDGKTGSKISGKNQVVKFTKGEKKVDLKCTAHEIQSPLVNSVSWYMTGGWTPPNHAVLQSISWFSIKTYIRPNAADEEERDLIDACGLCYLLSKPFVACDVDFCVFEAETDEVKAEAVTLVSHVSVTGLVSHVQHETVCVVLACVCVGPQC